MDGMSEYAMLISIHALVKRATHHDNFFVLLLWYFNPRPRKEGDAVKAADLRKV